MKIQVVDPYDVSAAASGIFRCPIPLREFFVHRRFTLYSIINIFQILSRPRFYSHFSFLFHHHRGKFKN